MNASAKTFRPNPNSPEAYHARELAHCLGIMHARLDAYRASGFGLTRAEQAADAKVPAQAQSERANATKKGFRVKARVVDSEGRPVQGAKAVLGTSYWQAKMPSTVTDSHGELFFEHCAEGPTVVTVQAGAFAPELQEVRVGERLEPLAFRLQPASVLRLRVVDVHGKPVAGAFVYGQTWREYQTIDLRKETNSDGRFAWSSAPRDAVLYDIGKTGFMSRSAIRLIASEREQVITLHPKLVITCRVTDAETGQPLPKCVIVKGVGFKGVDRISWNRRTAADVYGGAFTVSFDEPNDTMYVRVEALGFKPAVSRAFRFDEAAQSFDFVLERAETVTGIVQLSDGKPAEGVDVILATEADQVLFDGGRFESRTSAPRSKTGPDGRFWFTAPTGDFLLVALGDAGYADASPADLAKSGKLTLEPWGRLEGAVMAGSRPKANEEISFSPIPTAGHAQARGLRFRARPRRVPAPVLPVDAVRQADPLRSGRSGSRHSLRSQNTVALTPSSRRVSATLYLASMNQPPSGLAAIMSQKFGRRYPGSVRSRMSVFIVPNAVAGLEPKPSLNARTIPCLKSMRG